MHYEGAALTVAGLDSGGGAGIQADLKTFQAFKVFGVSVITSITAQNTLGVRSIQDIDPEIVGDQIDMIMEDMGCNAAKTGMVSNGEIITVIADRARKHKIDKLVVDPVMVSKSGNRLLKKAARKITEMVAKNVLIKGGHLKGNKAIDILFGGGKYTVFESERIDEYRKSFSPKSPG
jgi:hydroxymethylpyrimidine/phosphomethylpyrimidine kinase